MTPLPPPLAGEFELRHRIYRDHAGRVWGELALGGIVSKAQLPANLMALPEDIAHALLARAAHAQMDEIRRRQRDGRAGGTGS